MVNQKKKKKIISLNNYVYMKRRTKCNIKNNKGIRNTVCIKRVQKSDYCPLMDLDMYSAATFFHTFHEKEG